MDVRPIEPLIGAEVFGADISRLSDAELSVVRGLWLRHGVVVFRDQEDLTHDGHVRFARHFGEPERYVAGDMKDPEILRFEHNVDAPPTENVWHSDMSFRSAPPVASVLRGVVIPACGGDTVFADMRKAWQRVPQSVRELVRDLRAEHDIAKMADASMADQLRAAWPVLEQPVVRIHPVTKEEILFVNAAYTTRVVGLSDSDGAALVDYLARASTVPEVQCRIHWTEGTVVVWDNRSVQHYAVADYLPARRVMERVTLVDGVAVDARGVPSGIAAAGH
jgi:taurine dioxygenase